MSMFQIQQAQARYVFNGAIDENADFSSIDKNVLKIHINFAAVTGINSLGVARLLNFATDVGSAKLVYEQCPIILVTAFIMVPALLGTEENTASILSLQVPYACTACKRFETPYLQANMIRSTGHHLIFPIYPCPSCKASMSTHGIAEEYMSLFEAGAMAAA